MWKNLWTLVGSFLISLPFLNANQELKRPQEPVRPYPYHEEEVTFENTKAKVTLSGTLTYPQSTGPFPVVVLLHGSAPLDRDSTLFGHKPFLVWADHLTRQGIAVLRFDKRSAGKSTGNYEISTLEDFASDALAAVSYLKQRKEINPKQIGLIGHSEGGMTAALAASKTKDISFIVLMAAPCANWEDLVYEQETSFQRADGMTEEVIEENRKLRSQVFAVLKQEKDRIIAKEKLQSLFANYFETATSDQKQKAESYYGSADEQIQFFNSVWFRYNFRYDPVKVLKKIKIPVLALNGERDLVVSSHHLARIAKALESAGNKQYKTVKLPQLNHAFQTCKIGSAEECAAIEETISPAALQTISDWILERAKS